jgi:hypothetical protein
MRIICSSVVRIMPEAAYAFNQGKDSIIQLINAKQLM